MTEKFVNKIYIFYLLYFIMIPFGFLIRVIYTKTLSLSEVGIIYSLISFFSILIGISRIGMNKTVNIYLSKYLIKNKKDKIKNIFLYNLIIPILINLIFIFLILTFINFFKEKYFKIDSSLIIFIFLIYFILSTIFISIGNFLNGLKQNTLFIILNLFNFSINFILIIISNYLFEKEKLLIIYIINLNLALFITILISLFILIKKKKYLFEKPKINKDELSNFLKKSTTLFISELSLIILYHSDIQVISYFLNQKFVAIYSNIAVILNLITSLFLTITIILTPKISELFEEKKIRSIQIIIKIIYKLIFFLLIPIIIVLITFSKTILSKIYTPDFLNYSNILIIFSIFLLFKLLFNINLMIINSNEKYNNKINRYIIIISILNIILNIILVKIYNIYGIIISTIISWILLFISSYIIINKNIFKIKLTLIDFVKIFSLSFLFYFIVIYLKNNIYLYNFYLTSTIILFISFSFYIITGVLIKLFSIKEITIILPKINKNYFKRFKILFKKVK